VVTSPETLHICGGFDTCWDQMGKKVGGGTTGQKAEFKGPLQFPKKGKMHKLENKKECQSLSKKVWNKNHAGAGQLQGVSTELKKTSR